jgi:hypothetical protein
MVTTWQREYKIKWGAPQIIRQGSGILLVLLVSLFFLNSHTMLPLLVVVASKVCNLVARKKTPLELMVISYGFGAYEIAAPGKQ